VAGSLGKERRLTVDIHQLSNHQRILFNIICLAAAHDNVINVAEDKQILAPGAARRGKRGGSCGNEKHMAVNNVSPIH